MELKSLIEKITFVNDSLGYSDDTEKLINKEYLLKDDLHALKELEKLITNSIKYTQSQELKLGLEIILILIFHKNENVKAAALGKLFILMDDGLIQALVLKELKNMSNSRDKDDQESVDHSLDLIASEIHKLEIVDATFDLLAESANVLKVKVSQFKDIIIPSFYFLNRKSSAVTSKIKGKITNYYLFKGLLFRFHVFSSQIDRMVPCLEEIEDTHENLIQPETTRYLAILNAKSSEKESLQKLTNFYASTFTEKGHLRRLIALLDDDDYDIQQMGVNALTDVVEFLLTDSNNKKFTKPLNIDLGKILSIRD